MKNRFFDDLHLPLYYKMLKIRLIEETIANEYSKGYMRCPTHLSIGQEAIAVGVCQNLKDTDYVLSNHRAHAHYLAKGGSFKKMLAEIMGKKDGCCSGRGGSMHLVDVEKGFLGSTPIVAGTIPIAVGVALSSQMKNEDNITVVFLGDGATETGVFSESLNFAALKNLNIIFVCENNYYSVYSPLNVRQAKNRDRVKIAEANGLFAKKQKDGNDVLTVYSGIKECIDVIKNDKTPCYIEFDTYRYKEHCGPNNDDDLNYRPIKESDYWFNNCPIKKFENFLLKNEKITQKTLKEIKNDLLDEINKTFVWAKNLDFSVFNLSNEEKIYS
ncbi:MAG: Acetoin:2,6-dichlorophenolindophenol oxidoreductase subunit alpha [Candidatus Anoxychlamydiales bacterium]|nr:Acetoin:2,6-dichlorophenolindophenol oxidoreductase subunit alpha [Candidatus Anoxychlamydiales bacterium]